MPDDVADRFFIILKGTVCVYKRREEHHVQAETEFSNTAIAVVNQHYRTRQDEFVLIEEILSWVDEPLKSKYRKMKGVKGSKINFYQVNNGVLEYSKEFTKKQLQYFSPQEVLPETGLYERNGVLAFNCVGVLREGMVFGEKGIDEGTPRTATIVCLTDCDFACLLKKDYDKLLRDVTKDQLNRIKDFFVSDVFKHAIGKTIVANLGGDFSKTQLTMKKGQAVFSQGQFDSNVYIIKDGVVTLEHELTKEVPIIDVELSQARKIKIVYAVCQLGKGEILGEDCLYVTGSKIYTARVTSDFCTLYMVSKSCIQNYAVLASEVAEFFSQVHLSKEHSREQLLKNLLRAEGSLREEDIDVPKKEIDDWLQHRYKKPTKEQVIKDFGQFKSKYCNDLTEFVREVAPSRVPKLVMMKDYEDCASKNVISQEEKKLLDHIGSVDFYVKDSSFQEINKQRLQLRNHQRCVVRNRMKEVRHQLATVMYGHKTTKSLDECDSSFKGTSQDRSTERHIRFQQSQVIEANEIMYNTENSLDSNISRQKRVAKINISLQDSSLLSTGYSTSCERERSIGSKSVCPPMSKHHLFRCHQVSVFKSPSKPGPNARKELVDCLTLRDESQMKLLNKTYQSPNDNSGILSSPFGLETVKPWRVASKPTGRLGGAGHGATTTTMVNKNEDSLSLMLRQRRFNQTIQRIRDNKT